MQNRVFHIKVRFCNGNDLFCEENYYYSDDLLKMTWKVLLPGEIFQICSIGVVFGHPVGKGGPLDFHMLWIFLHILAQKVLLFYFSKVAIFQEIKKSKVDFTSKKMILRAPSSLAKVMREGILVSTSHQNDIQSMQIVGAHKSESENPLVSTRLFLLVSNTCVSQQWG